MAATGAATPMKDRGDTYRRQMQQMAELRTAMNAAALASGAFNVQTVKTLSSAERLTNSIRDQKVGWTQARKELRAYHKEVKGGANAPRSALGDAIRQQTALRNAMATQWPGGNAFGRNNTDMYIPRNLGSDLDNINTKYGMTNRLLYSAARNTVNWGKNTQWAGRQIMVGLTVPLGMLAVGAGVLAAKVDKELTRVAKVYDTVATTAEGRERELTQVRNVGLKQASSLAQEYGTKMEDVINIQAQLAATGLNGNKLFSSTRETSRIATLGEMDTQSSIDMTVALQTAFRDTIKTAEDLTETFNFFNSVENATSLAIQDIAEATPRAASAMAALGVDAKEMTVMLVAMKESGVDAAEAANALKSGASRILDPSREAIAYWKDSLGKDLPEIVSKAGGNMFEFMKEVSVALKGFDPQTVMTAISKTFGVYQFNRITALVDNMGDALTGTTNQTSKAFELLGTSAEEHATKAEQELSALQESISFKFKAAVQSIKAELIPFGEVALQVGTIILNYLIKPILTGFNALSDPMKLILLGILGFGAIAGPLLMITGIFANLFGSIMGVGLQLGNLRWKFKALTIDEQAARINANTAASAFNTQASSAAYLAQQINVLTASMERNALASGAMVAMNNKGVISQNGYNRTVQQVTGTQHQVYGAGSRDATGKPIAGRRVTNPVDVAAFRDMQARTASMATNAAATQRSMSTAGKAVGIMAVGAIAIGALASGSDAVNEKWINIAMIVGMIAFMAPGLFTKPVAATLLMLRNLRAAGAAGVMGKISTGARAIAGSFSNARAGGAGVTRSLGTMMGTIGRMLPMALRVFGPLGAIAAGAWALKKINDEMNEVKENAIAVGEATKDWADAQGWDFNPGQLPGMKPEEVKGQQARVELIEKMTKANKNLDDAMVEAAQGGREFEVALDQAMSALASGASVEDAEEIFQAALDMAGLTEAEIDTLTVRYKTLNLEDPQNLKDQLNQAVSNTAAEVDVTGNIRPGDDAGGGIGGFFKGLGGDFMEDLGRNLTPEAEAAAQILGTRFATAFSAAGTNTFRQADAIKAAGEQYDQMFSEMYKDIQEDIEGDEDVVAAFESLGINGANKFVSEIGRIKEKMDNDKTLTDAEETLFSAYEDSGAMYDLEQSADQYWDNYVDSMVTAGTMTDAEGELMKKQLHSIFDLFGEWDTGVTGIMSQKDALAAYNAELHEARVKGIELTAEEIARKKAHWLAAAGIEEGSTAAENFGDKALEAAFGVGVLADAAKEAADAAAGLMQVTADDLAGAQKDAMSGAMSDIFAEADRQFQDMQEKNLDSIRAGGDARQAAMQREGDLMEEDFDRRQGEMEWFWDVREQAMEDEWEAREEALEADAESRIDAEERYWDERIEGVEAAMEAEQKAEEKRQQIFENEQRRIDRMASSLNSNIDFNVALNSGDLDEAAKIANDSIAQQNSWSMEDQNRLASEASAARVDKLQGELEELQTLKDARLEEIKTVQEARKKALQEEAEAAKAQFNFLRALTAQQLDDEREASKKALDQRMEDDRKATESELKRIQTEQEAQRRAMEIELKTLQEFIPKNEAELRAHTEKVTAVYNKYGLDLQTEGGKWGAFVGDALRVNVESASIAMQTQIDWRAIAANIAQQIGDGLGMTMQQVQDFLRTGVFPSTPPVARVGPVLPGQSTGASSANAAERRMGYQHIGGIVGGGGTGQRDRSGIPLGASPYSSEQMILAKKGEYLVNDKASRKNRGLLDAINAGKDIGGTGLLQHTAAQASMQMGAVAQMMGMVAYEKTRQAKAAYEAQQAAMYSGGGSTGTIMGGNSPWQRLWNTIKTQFPKAGLNSAYEDRRGDPGYHGKGMAVDLGLAGTPGGAGNSYMADMNRWIYDNFRGSTQLIYNGLGDDRPNLLNGRDHAYDAATQAAHRNHVHWAMTPEAIEAAGRKIASGANAAPGMQFSGAGVERWRPVVMQALGMLGLPGAWAGNTLRRMNQESGGNPRAINNWDINAKRGTPSKGLMQVIDPTFRANWDPRTPNDIWDPLANIVASMRYATKRYGSLPAAYDRPGGYDNGGWMMPGQTGINLLRKPEPVFNPAQWEILKGNIGNTTYDVPGRANAVPMPVRVVDNVANGGETRYDITVDLRGAVVKDDIDFQAAVEKAIDNIENRKGRRRTI